VGIADNEKSSTGWVSLSTNLANELPMMRPITELSKMLKLAFSTKRIFGMGYSRLVCGSLLLTVALVGACGNKRTSFAEWETRTFPKAGLTIEIPRDMYKVTDRNTRVLLLLHPIPGGNWLADVQFGLIVSLEEITEEAFREMAARARANQAYNEADEEGKTFIVWYDASHQEIEAKSFGHYMYYRRDIPLKNGNILKCSAELRRYVYLPEDDVAIRRILASVREM
jgi:hypothetical protein